MSEKSYSSETQKAFRYIRVRCTSTKYTQKRRKTETNSQQEN